MSHQDLGQNLARKIQEDIGDSGQVESYPRLEGRQMIMMVGPKKK
jgi:translation initiation factor IF-3